MTHTFDFDKITVEELDKGLSSGRYSDETRKLIAKSCGVDEKDLAAMKVTEYKKLVANFVKAAYSPVDADPN